MSDVVEKYWSGVSRRLQIEVDSFSRLVQHNGEKGRQNELALSALLSRMLPTSVSVGTGIIIDSYGNESNQTDLIISHTGKQPALLAQTIEVLHPVETVLLAIEVKSTVAERDVADFAEKKAAHNHLALRSGKPVPPLAFFGYGSGALPMTTSRYFLELERDLRPDFLAVVDPGIFGEQEIGGDRLSIGLTPRHLNDGWDYAKADDRPPVALRDNVGYPVTRIGKQTSERVVAEPSRALLLFCETLLRRLATSEAADGSWISHYLTKTARLGIGYSLGTTGETLSQLREELGCAEGRES
ncbi:DUF6602 domain-containing protein [Arthrobacter sp. UYEF3]|uniref:DUF6602 domain-containing protein n=1 Tax=Arthrobacter sp. UYEF3 TaxID=1756365 RepID=UPI003392EB51